MSNYEKEYNELSEEYAQDLKDFFIMNNPLDIVNNEHIIIKLKNYAIDVEILNDKFQED